MGRSRRGRRDGRPDVDGVLIVDKPAGMTSHDVVQVVRRAVGQRRVGHTGTLDPDATGVLVLCLGRATRLVQYLQAGRKTYAATMVLGRETTSQDASGDVVAEADAGHLDERTVCDAMARFQGEISQVPPMVSALKVDGERLHAKARRGETVDREPRPVTIHDLVLEDFRAGARAEVSFLVTCSAGTYVRTLAHDLGQDLGVGGSLVSLRRLANGAFTVDDAVSLDAVVAAGERDTIEALLCSPHQSVRGLPAVEVDDPTQLLALAQGKPMAAQGRDGVYAVVSGTVLVGIYRDRGGQARSELVWLRPEELGEVGAAPPTDGPGGGTDAIPGSDA
jgi:tRNA pseudouridine55 synthase